MRIPALLLPAALAMCLASPRAWAAAREAQGTVVDDFEDVAGWSAVPADGVEMSLHSDTGESGNGLRIDFNFVKGGGYAVAHKKVDLDLPANYRFRFDVRGQTKPQTLEFKLIDSTGDNVWWMNRRDFAFTPAWQPVKATKRQLPFAWGPQGGGEIRHVAAIEFAVTSSSGGKGSVWIDALVLEPMAPPNANPPRPKASATSLGETAKGKTGAAANAVDGDPKTVWRSGLGPEEIALSLDLQVQREISAITLDWEAGHAPADYDIEIAGDNDGREVARQVRGSNGGRDVIYLPDTIARTVRIVSHTPRPPGGVGISEVTLQPAEWAPTITDFFMQLAKAAPRGDYPRGLVGEQSYWTVLGADADSREVLFDEDARLELVKAGGSIEPFLAVDGGKLVTWASGTRGASLSGGWRPLATVSGTGADSIGLAVTAFVEGDSASPVLRARYRVTNRSPKSHTVTLYLAFRPFQVNPPAQFLNTTGGVATQRSISLAANRVRIDGTTEVEIPTLPGEDFGAVAYDGGDVVGDWIAKGRIPSAQSVDDPFGHASAVARYFLEVQPGGANTVEISAALRGRRGHVMPRSFDEAFAATDSAWIERRGPLTIDLPAAGREVLETLEAQLAYVRINRDGPAVQPGSRSYERSWIRDGALTSSAMLRAGQPDVAKAFAEWFAPYQYDDGTVPCCVDRRGADPVPEHDSHGELIYLIAEVTRYTGDRAWASRMWPYVAKAAAHLDSLRGQRRTPEWRTPANAPYFGLLPPSISHEGYSAKPMHSYWDDFFALRGYKDAVWLAEVTGHAAERTRFAASRDTFAADLAASIRAARAAHGIDFVPGCADLGDFDATSTTIALNPAEAEDVATPQALTRTFERYWEFFEKRRDGKEAWDAFTPYEIRNVGAFVRLGWRDRANAALDWFLGYRRPPGFRHWAEVVDHDERHERFIGDMPHTWVGTDYVRSVLDMFAYPRADSALVVGAGLPRAWIAAETGVLVRALATPFGALSFSMRAYGEAVTTELGAMPRVPPGGIVVVPPPPTSGKWTRATVGGKPTDIAADGGVTVRKLPAKVVFE